MGVHRVQKIHDYKSTTQPREKVPCQGKKDEDLIHIKGLGKVARISKMRYHRARGGLSREKGVEGKNGPGQEVDKGRGREG